MHSVWGGIYLHTYLLNGRQLSSHFGLSRSVCLTHRDPLERTFWSALHQPYSCSSSGLHLTWPFWSFDWRNRQFPAAICIAPRQAHLASVWRRRRWWHWLAEIAGDPLPNPSDVCVCPALGFTRFFVWICLPSALHCNHNHFRQLVFDFLKSCRKGINIVGVGLDMVLL